MQQNVVRGVISGAIHQERPDDVVRKIGVNSATQSAFVSAAGVATAAGVKSDSFVRTAIDGTVGGAVSVARGGKFVVGFASAGVGSLAGRFTSDGEKTDYRPDLSAPSSALVAGIMTGWDPKAMQLQADIGSASAFGHIAIARAKAIEIETMAARLAGPEGVAAGSAPEDAAEYAETATEEDRNLSFAAKRAEELISLAEKYAKFSEEYPRRAAALEEKVLPMVGVLVDTVAGSLACSAIPGVGTVTCLAIGFRASMVNLAHGQAIDTVAGEAISDAVSAGIEQASKAWKNSDPTLTDQQAQALGAASVIAAMTLKSQFKTASTVLKSIGGKINAGKTLNPKVSSSIKNEINREHPKVRTSSSDPIKAFNPSHPGNFDVVKRDVKFGKLYRDSANTALLA